MRIVARVLAALLVVGVSLSAAAQNCAGSRDIRIVNGRIHTMDAHDTVVSSVTIRRDVPKVGRNDPCPCGSGKKYKQCHGA